MTIDQLDNRAQHLLRLIVERYVRDGKPVGSRLLTQLSGLDLSPATIRSVMADLEQAGLLTAPHTSAGRIPTAQGYRFFVDALITASHAPGQGQTYRLIEDALQEPDGVSNAVASASKLLSELTSFVGLVTVPKRDSFAFKQIEFVSLSQTEILVVLVFADNEIQNRLIRTQKPFKSAELEHAARFLNQEFAGLMLPDIKQRLVRDMARAKQQMDDIMRSAIAMAENAFDGIASEDMIVAGQAQLMRCTDLANIMTLQSLFDAFQEKQDLLHLLEESVDAQGVNLFIGEESGQQALENCSLVSAPYSVNGQVLGALGVIGPTRMSYQRVISVVQATADVLGTVLNHRK